MSKGQIVFIVLVLLLTAFNAMLWLNFMQGGPAPRGGRIMGLVIMLAAGALLAEKISNNPYAPGFIRVGCVLGLIGMLFILSNP